MIKRRILAVVFGLLFVLVLLNIDTAIGIVQGGVSFDLSVKVVGVTVNAYHFQRGSRYNWGIQQWGYDP